MSLRFALPFFLLAESLALAQAPEPTDRSVLPSWVEVQDAVHGLDADPVLARASPAAATSPRAAEPPPFSELYWRAFVGQAIGAAGGALLGLVITAATGCTNGEGWLSGYTCEAGLGYAATMGAMLAAPIGTGAGIVLGGIALDRRRDAGEAYLWSAIGALPGLLTGALAYLMQDQLSLAFLLGALIEGGLSPLIGTALYRDSRAAAAAAITPMPARAGLGLAIGGSF